MRKHKLTEVCTTRFSLKEMKKEAEDMREKIERQNQQMSNYEAEMKLLRQQGESWDNERQKYKREIDTLQDALNRTRTVSSATL